MTSVETYLKKFSETGRPVFKIASESARKLAQYHIGEGHIIVALFQIAPDWVAFRVSQKGAAPEQIIAAAEREMRKIKPYTKGGTKIHPSAAYFFKRAMKFAKAEGRSQIDYIDLIAALDSRIEDLQRERKDFNPILVKGFRRLKKLFDERRRFQ
jgi:ATP-dependent Clp protease ATP-binding subunit ClpA